MGFPLKYRIPLLIFIVGIILVVLQSYIQMDSEYKRMIENTSAQAKIIGNRLASQITFKIKNQGFSEQTLISLTAPYMAESLDQVNLYNEKLEPIFSRYIPTDSADYEEAFESGDAYKVVKDQFSTVTFKEKDRHIIGYFPIDLPVKTGEVLARHKGVMFLVFDVTSEFKQTKNAIIKTAVMNVATVTIMILFFSALMYFLIFKRLNALHRASLELSQGNFDVEVENKWQDELSQVIGTFNTMAKDMKDYKETMQERVDKAIEERTEQSKLLIQQSKLASMGEMIGNIAHQWRQPLNALGLLIQKLELFSSRGKLTEELLKENVEKANTIINNMSTTIDDFRDFFKPNKQLEYFNLNAVIHEVINLLEAGLNEADISLNIHIEESDCELYGYKNEFAQVIVNLINNAKDAMIEKGIDNRKISICAKKTDKHIMFTLSDNAGGISKDLIDRIFEPYFTTKEEGKGTGIGLYMSKMIIEENMGGKIHVKNNKDGAEFTMTFKNTKEQL